MNHGRTILGPNNNWLEQANVGCSVIMEPVGNRNPGVANGETVQQAQTSGGTETVSRWRWWEEKAVWAAIPFAGYFLSYRYECGFCDAFKVPDYFVQVDLMGVLSFTALMVGWSFVLLSFWESLWELTNMPGATGPRLVRRYSPLVLLAVMLVFLAPPKHVLTTAALGLIVIIPLADAIRARLDPSPGKRFLEKMADGPPIHSIVSPFRFIHKQFGIVAVALVTFVYSGAFFSFQMGHLSALTQTNFLVPSADTNSVVVRKYGDRLVCAVVDPKTKKVSGQFLILSSSSERGVKLESKNLGKLSFDQ